MKGLVLPGRGGLKLEITFLNPPKLHILLYNYNDVCSLFYCFQFSKAQLPHFLNPSIHPTSINSFQQLMLFINDARAPENPFKMTWQGHNSLFLGFLVALF